MSQPGMQPEGAYRKGGARRGDLRRRDPRRRDLLGRAFPQGDWEEPYGRLNELYQWVEHGALRIVEWYLVDRVWKRRGARVLRAGAAAGVAAGAALPLLEVTGTVPDVGAWGYVALLGAAACVGADRYFGLTAGWMRDVATAQAVQRRLEALQYDWATESIREVLGPAEGTTGEAAERSLGVLRRFSEDVAEIVRDETTDWMTGFRAGPVPLQTQAVAARAAPRARQEEDGLARGGCPTANERFTLPPGTRPSMPRQRPPGSGPGGPAGPGGFGGPNGSGGPGGPPRFG
ncbi:SLATT domain-containing protein [Streptomyces daliensis]